MRIIGIDVGEKRIGVAAADDRTHVAVPLTAIEADGDPVGAIAGLIQEQNADELVVGLPLSMSGAMGRQAQLTMGIVEAVRERTTIPVHTWDERLTTAQAMRSTGKGSRRGAKKGTRDAIAAAILLQAFLDGRRSTSA